MSRIGAFDVILWVIVILFSILIGSLLIGGIVSLWKIILS